jgi:hypothetical protein
MRVLSAIRRSGPVFGPNPSPNTRRLRIWHEQDAADRAAGPDEPLFGRNGSEWINASKRCAALLNATTSCPVVGDDKQPGNRSRAPAKPITCDT